ncbi:MAG: hypothetical protein ACR2H9_14740, partial [Longimicrobiaceae bacterium]
MAHLEEGSREWDRFVARSEEGTFCHLAGWREIMADVLSHQTRYLVAKDGEGKWQGVLPLVRVRSRIFGHYLLSMPFMSYGGPLGTSAAQARLTEEAVEQARQWGVDLLELRARHPVPADLPTSHRKITVLLPLPETTEQLWKGTFAAPTYIRDAAAPQLTPNQGIVRVYQDEKPWFGANRAHAT